MRLFAKFMGVQSEEEDINMKIVEEERQRQETSIKLDQQPHTKKEVGLLNLNMQNFFQVFNNICLYIYIHICIYFFLTTDDIHYQI